MYKISFNVDKAYEHLSENGFVYTLRPMQYHGKPVKPSGGMRKVVRNGEETGENIEKIYKGPVTNISMLEEYVDKSGFDSIEEWTNHASGDSYYLFLCVSLKGSKIMNKLISSDITYKEASDILKISEKEVQDILDKYVHVPSGKEEREARRILFG